MAKAKTVAWKNLKHAQGPATRVPAQVKQLFADDAMERHDAYWALWEGLVGHGAWFDASAPAVALLLDTAEKASDPTLLFTLTGDILGGDQIRGWLAPADAKQDLLEKAAHDAALEKKKVLLDALGAASGVVRGAAAMALAMLPEMSAESVPVLSRLAREDDDVIARSSAVLALGRLGDGDASVAALLAAMRKPGLPGFVRGAAVMGWLRQDGARPFEEARAEVEEWLGFKPSPGVELPWFRDTLWFATLPFPDAPARLLCALGRHRGQGGVDALADFAAAGSRSDNGPVETQLAKVLLGLGGFPQQHDKVALVQDLTAEQHAMARMLSKRYLLPAGGHRLPAAGVARRRWIGLDTPGPLDRVVSHNGAEVPLWRAWNEKRPLSVDDFASRLDYWQALVEYNAETYPPPFERLTPDEVDRELAALPGGDELLARVPQIADDLAARFAAAARGGTPKFVNYWMSGLLLLPWVRAGRPIEPRWDVLIPVGPEPQCRELIAALPIERREAVICEVLTLVNRARITVTLAVLDLAPTRRVAEATQRAIDELQKQPKLAAPAQALREKLKALAQQHPGLAL